MSATIRAARACASTLLFHSLRLQAFRGAVPHVLVVVDRVPCALQKVVAEGYLQVLRAYQRDGAAYLAHDSDSVASAAAAPPEAVETPHPSHDGTLFVSLAPGTETPCGSAGFTAAAAPPHAPPSAPGEDPAPLSYSLMPFRCESFLDDVKRLQRFFRHCGDGRHTPSSLEVNESDTVAPPAPSRAVWTADTFEAEYDALCPLLGPLLSSQGESVEEAADAPRWRALFTGPPRELLGCVLIQEHAFQNELRRYRLRLGLFDLGMRVAEHCHLRIMSHNADRLAEAGRLRAVLDDDEVFSYARSCAFRPAEVLCLAKAIADSIDLHSWHRAGAAQAAAPASVAAALHNPVLQAVFNDGALQGGATAAAGVADLGAALRLPIEGPGVPLSVVCRDASKVLTYAGGMEDCLTNTGYYAAAYAPERNDVALHRERFQVVYSEEGVAGEGSEGEGEGEGDGAAGAAAVHGRLKKRDFLALRKSKKQQKPGKAQPGSDEDEDGAVSRSAPAGSCMSNSIGGTFPIGEVISESFDLSQLSGSCDVFAYPGAFKQVTLSKPAPFTMTVDRGVVTQLGDGAPAEFVDLISLVRQVEGQCHVRELGIGLNPYVGPAHVVSDVTSFERQWGIHLSLGQRHPLFVKQRERRNADGTVAAAVRVEGPVLKRKAGKYHIDVFVDAAQLRMGDVFAIDFTKGIAVR